MNSLPPFSGDDPPCIKCGWTDARTEYLPFGDCAHGLGDRTTVGFQPNERLHRECTRCGYQWDEAIVEPCSCTPNDTCTSCYARRNP